MLMSPKGCNLQNVDGHLPRRGLLPTIKLCRLLQRMSMANRGL